MSSASTTSLHSSIGAPTFAETGGTVPYLLTRRYGKGMVVLCSDAIHRVSANRLLENLVLFHEHHRAAIR